MAACEDVRRTEGKGNGKIATIFVHNHRGVLLFRRRARRVFLYVFGLRIRFDVSRVLNGDVDVGFSCVRVYL